jgi:hypothetical protein
MEQRAAEPEHAARQNTRGNDADLGRLTGEQLQARLTDLGA